MLLARGGSYLGVGLACAVMRNSPKPVCASMSGVGSSSTCPTVRVATYNVLSDNLCRDNHYIRSLADDLDNEKRLSRVKAQIQAEMDKGSIICLQEVSRKWGGELLPFFEANGYVCASGPYGNPFNGYMGVAVAWPRATMAVQEVVIERVTDTVEFVKPLDWPCPKCGANVFGSKTHCFKCNTPKPFPPVAVAGASAPVVATSSAESKAATAPPSPPPTTPSAPSSPSGVVATTPAAQRGIFASLSAVLGALFGVGNGASLAAPTTSGFSRPRAPWNTWDVVSSKQNIAVCVKLQDRGSGREFAVVTYHMPCMFGSDEKCQVMTAHVALLMQAAQNFANDLPLVVAGDFNILPDTPPYDLVINGCMDPTHPQHPPLPAPIKPKKDDPTITTAATAAASSEPARIGSNLNVGSTTTATEATAAAAGAAAVAASSWDASFAPMRSAYREAEYPNKPTGREPQFTNYALSAFMPEEPFVGTLDYLFLSKKGWAPVMHVKPLAAFEDTKAIHPVGFPVASEPSDHMLLAADLVLLEP